MKSNTWKRFDVWASFVAAVAVIIVATVALKFEQTVGTLAVVVYFFLSVRKVGGGKNVQYYLFSTRQCVGSVQDGI